MTFVTRAELLEVCRLVYDRWLTNAGGSNFSGRLTADSVLLTATGNAKRTRLRMSADDLLHVKLDGTILEGSGELSSSWSTHRGLYQAFPQIGAVIHAHPFYATIFAAHQRDMPVLLDGMRKYGTIPCLSGHNKIDSAPFVEEVVSVFGEHRDTATRTGFGVLYPGHGVLVAGPTLDDAYDLLERMEFNAAALILGRLLDGTPPPPPAGSSDE
ncbi:MAG: class II aldolase/adducin family protein [Thermomicrobiales bacterium]|nr:class II aldolase/adducin family protein [Thermomicrobiales bacterium]